MFRRHYVSLLALGALSVRLNFLKGPNVFHMIHEHSSLNIFNDHCLCYLCHKMAPRATNNSQTAEFEKFSRVLSV